MTAAAQKQIAAKALELPRAARLQLLHKSVESLEPAGEKIRGKELEEAWTTEVNKRIADIDSGKVKMIPYSEVRKRMKRLLQVSEQIIVSSACRG